MDDEMGTEQIHVSEPMVLQVSGEMPPDLLAVRTDALMDRCTIHIDREPPCPSAASSRHDVVPNVLCRGHEK